jgi:exonuclease SbcC
MNLPGKKYPRIYSISTVGVRNHNNADLLIHPLRTDFTGQSGTGKSLIAADLPQLILTAGKFYKSATQSKDPREYNEIPLKKFSFAYAFMNIEIKKGKFIVIGVMIKRSPKQLHPFIIQGQMGLDADKNSTFKPLDKIIRFKDFLANEEMLTIDNFEKKFDKQGIYISSFFHKTKEYHKLLKENKILHLDLSDDENLQKQYAHSLQTLSRGNEIATEGNAFKRFLFHYDDDISKKFKEQSKAIEDDHRKYEEDWKTQNILSKKKTAMSKLLSLKKVKIAAHEERLTKETAYFFQQHLQKEKAHKEATAKYFQTELELIVVNERKNVLETQSVKAEIDGSLKKFNEEKRKYKEAKSKVDEIETLLKTLTQLIEQLEIPYKDLNDKKTKIEQVEKWLEKYSEIDNIRTTFEKQNKFSLQKEKLQALNNFLTKSELTSEFESSEYAKSFKQAIEFYSSRRGEIKTEIVEIKKLQDIIKSQNSDSLAGWAVKGEIKLNELQESVLFHFATKPTKYNKSEDYIPKPKEFIDSLNEVKQTDLGFVINLSGLHYHIPKRENYIFGNPKKLKAEIERIGKNYQDEIDKLNAELTTIEKLDKLFSSDFTYSEDHLNAYRIKEEIGRVTEDLSLKLTKEQLEERINLYQSDERQPNAKKVKTLFPIALEKYSEKLNLRATSTTTKESNLAIKANALIEAKRIREDFQTSINRLIEFKKEKVTHEANVTSWKSQIEVSFKNGKEILLNPLKKNNDETILKMRAKYNGEKIVSKLLEKYSDLREAKGQEIAEIESIKLVIPFFKQQSEVKAKDFQKHFNKEFILDGISQLITDEMLNGENGIKAKESSTKSVYEKEYNDTIDSFADELKDNPVMKRHDYDLNTLILELIPHEIISNKDNPEDSLDTDIENKLAKLSQQIRELNIEEAKKIYNTVKDLKRIVQQQTTFLETVKALLKDFKLATYNRVLLDWKFSTDYNLQWIDFLNEDIESSNYTDNLFGDKSKISAQELLENNFKKYCPSKIDAKAADILNPFNYYDASAKIVDPNDEKNPGSSGQNYGMLALLCIAKLSIVEGKTKDGIEKIDSGIRILPIDEVAGLGENFDMLYDIAQRLDYQIFTMTIAANDLTFENGKQIYYEFIKNSNEKLFEYNEGIQACFSKDNLIDDIETHFEDSLFNLEFSTE